MSGKKLGIVVFVEQQLNALNREVVHERLVEVGREFLVEAFGVEVWVKRGRRSRPWVCKLASGQLQPFVRQRLVSYVASIHPNCFSSEKICKRLIR
jgi:hypothetical protein